MDRLKLLWQLERTGRKRRHFLRSLGIPESTYYHWRQLYRKEGFEGLSRKRNRSGRIWNRLLAVEEETILQVARENPELASRLVAVKVTDERGFNVSTTTAYRVLKRHGLIVPKPPEEYPAGKECRHKTTRPNEIWQSDGTTLIIAGWGYYKLILVLDDYSRKLLSWTLQPTETADAISEAVEGAVENTGIDQLPEDQKPVLLTDNGSGFTSNLLADYLKFQGIRHIFGKPYHPQTQGKVERVNRSLKEKLCLVIYTSPGELEAAIRKVKKRYNAAPHSAHKNVSPNDVYDGKKEEILERRKAQKEWTLARRKIVNLELKGKGPEQPSNCP